MKTRFKELAFLAIMAVFIPMSLSAQRNDAFISNFDEINLNRDSAIQWSIINNGIGQSEPLGSGLLILTAVGAGYAVARRRRNFKKGTTLLMAVALILGMTNCRKNVETINQVENGVYITLRVDDDSRVIVYPNFNGEYAKVDFEDGDTLYVGNNGKYVGKLVFDGSVFGGTINPTSESDYLHFYFLGNKTPGKKLADGLTTCSVTISDQTIQYPVISYGHSKSLYSSTQNAYQATLFNKCAIVKFSVTGAEASKAVTLRGMKNKVKVNFAANNGTTAGDPFTFEKIGYGEIALHAESPTERWAILLPQDAKTTTVYADGCAITTVDVPEITSNSYITTGTSEITLTAGTPSDLFTVASGTTVRFSYGNLQYQASNKMWRFAEHQYDFVGDFSGSAPGTVYEDGVLCGNRYISSSYNGWIDLFGFGTWGGTGNPVNTSSTGGDYSWTGDFNGTLEGYSWHTLSKDEVTYLFNTRTTNYGRYAKAKVNNIHGVILFPDVYIHPSGLTAPTGINATGTAGWTGNIYTADDWEKMELNGAVFLPASGVRQGNTVNNVDVIAYYWTKTIESSYWIYCLRVKSDEVKAINNHSDVTYKAKAIRLVR